MIKKLSEEDILRHRISWNNEFDCRDNYGSPMVVFRLAMVVYSPWISAAFFLIEAVWYYIPTDYLGIFIKMRK